MGDRKITNPNQASVKPDWVYIYGRIATALGWTFNYIGSELTYPDVAALFEYWDRFPPTHECIASAYQIKPKSLVTPVTQMPQQDQLQALASEMASAGFQGAIRYKKRSDIAKIAPDNPALLKMKERGVNFG